MLKSKKRINIYEPLKDFLQPIIDIEGIKFIDITAKIATESVVLTDDFMAILLIESLLRQL